MSSPNRTEREARIEQDKQNLQQTVYYTLKNRNGGGRAYHTDPDCHKLPGKYFDCEKQRAHARGFFPCAFCVLERDTKPTHTHGQLSRLEYQIRQGEVAEKHIGVDYDDTS